MSKIEPHDPNCATCTGVVSEPKPVVEKSTRWTDEEREEMAQRRYEENVAAGAYELGSDGKPIRVTSEATPVYLEGGWLQDGLSALCPECRRAKEGTVSWGLWHESRCAWRPAGTWRSDIERASRVDTAGDAPEHLFSPSATYDGSTVIGRLIKWADDRKQRVSAEDPPDDIEKAAIDWTYVALTIGFNELAKQHEKLGEKVYFRLLRDGAETKHVENGGKPFIARADGLMTIEVPGGPPHVVFREQDIEGMRAVVEAHDAKTQRRERATPVAVTEHEVQEALAIVNDHLVMGAAITHAGTEIKGRTPDGEGDFSKAYFSAGDCSELANAFHVLSVRLGRPA